VAKFVMPEDSADIPAVLVGMKTLHDCTEREFRNLRKAMARDRKLAADERKAAAKELKRVTEALGLDPHRQTPVALWTPAKVLRWFATMGGAFFVAAKLIDAVWPYALGAAVAIWRAAIH
jgi:hypothetical protein